MPMKLVEIRTVRPEIRIGLSQLLELQQRNKMKMTVSYAWQRNKSDGKK